MKLINGRGTCYDITEILLKITFKILNGYDRFQLGRTEVKQYTPLPLWGEGV
jgi:hypothetical protein